VSLLGLAVGDAYGASADPASADPAGPAGPAPAGPAGRAPAAAGPWRWTDDTEMACSVVRVLAEHGRIDPEVLGASFVEHYDESRDYGPGVDGMIREVGRRRTTLPVLAREVFGGAGSWGNGAAMRVAPLGAWFAGDPATAAREAAVSAEVTHTHPEGIAGAVATAVAAALAASGAPAAELLDSVLAHTPPGKVHDGIQTATTLPASDPTSAAATLGTGRRLSAPDTVPLALWLAANHLDDYAGAIQTAAPIAEDTDTVCAMVGGIIAGRVGRKGIPTKWRESCEPLPTWITPPSPG
jgi:ADP-ribosylglycohydrolase